MTIKEFFVSHGIEFDTVITLAELTQVIESGAEVFGEGATAFLMDCFSPEGEPIEPGYEDSLSHYRFDCCEDLNDLETVWQKYAAESIRG